MKRITIDVEYLHAVLRLDPDSGALYWRRRSVEMFKGGARRSAAAECRRWNDRFADQEAGSIDAKGYRQIKLLGVALKAHRIIRAMQTGNWPSENVDHRNGERDDNSDENIRDASYALNAQNQSVHRHNSSGLLGVTRKGARWQAQIGAAGKLHYLGLFDSKIDAHAAYLDAKRTLHPLNPIPRDA